MTSSLAGILVSSAPIFTAILAIAFAPEERSEGLRGVGVVAGIVGVATFAGLALILGGSYLAAEGRFPWQPRPEIPELPDADPLAGGLDPRTPDGERVPG